MGIHSPIPYLGSPFALQGCKSSLGCLRCGSVGFRGFRGPLAKRSIHPKLNPSIRDGTVGSARGCDECLGSGVTKCLSTLLGGPVP